MEGVKAQLCKTAVSRNQGFGGFFCPCPASKGMAVADRQVSGKFQEIHGMRR